MDNVLVFSKTFHKYRKHVKTVLAYRQVASFQLDINKCEFEVHETKYLGLIIQFTFPDGCPEYIKICPAKTSTIDSWESP